MLKVRADLADDYSDPGWYKHPEGHQAYDYNGELPELSKQLTPGNSLVTQSQLASAILKLFRQRVTRVNSKQNYFNDMDLDFHPQS